MGVIIGFIMCQWLLSDSLACSSNNVSISESSNSEQLDLVTDPVAASSSLPSVGPCVQNLKYKNLF